MPLEPQSCESAVAGTRPFDVPSRLRRAQFSRITPIIWLTLLYCSHPPKALASPEFQDLPGDAPASLFIPEFGTIGSWQETATPSAPTPPQNWAKLNWPEGLLLSSQDGLYHAAVYRPYQMVDWQAASGIGVNYDILGFFREPTIGTALFAPGDSVTYQVGVRGNVRASNLWFGSGTTKFFQLEGNDRIFNNPQGVDRPFVINVLRTTVEGSQGSSPRVPVNNEPVVEIGVPITVQGSKPATINIEGGKLTLSADNTFSNLTIRSWKQNLRGTIVINTPTPFGTANVTLLGNLNFEAKDDFSGNPTRVLDNSFTSPQAFAPDPHRPDVIFPNSSILRVQGSGNFVFNGNLTTVYNATVVDGFLIGGAGLGLEMSGSGVVTLNGANNFRGDVVVNSGTLVMGNNAAVNGQGSLGLVGGSIEAGGAPRTVSPASAVIVGNFAVTGLHDLTINAPVKVGGTRTVTVSVPTFTITGPISNIAAGAAGFVKEGTGTLVLSGLSTYTGGTNVNQGVLQLNNGGATGAIRGTVGVLNSGTLRLNATNSLGYTAGSKVDVINVVGGLIDNVADGDNGWGLTVNLNGATMRSNNGLNSATTPKLYTMGGDSRIATIASNTPSVISGRLQLREGNPNDHLPINVADGAAVEDLVIRAAITASGVGYGITKQGPGTLLLVGGNNDTTGAGSTYTGSTVVDGGLLVVDGHDGNRLSANNQVTVNSGGTFEVRGVNAMPLNTAAIDVTVNQGGVFRVVSGGSAFIGTLTESHAHIRNVALNGGTLDLTYSGTLSNWHGESFQLNGDLTVGGAAPSVIQTNAIANRQGIAFNGSRTFQVNDATLSPAADLTVNAELENSSTTPADDGLRKSGAGTLLLNYANTYSGPTVVEEGTLVLSGSISGSATINGGTLTGSGSARAVTINAGGTLAPGVGIGTLTTQSVAFNGGTLAIEINSSTLLRDTLAVVGDITLGATPVTLNITDLGGSAISGGTRLTLLTYTGTWDGQTFSWAGSPLLDDELFTVGLNSFRMDYGDTANKSFSIVVVPEPASWIVFGAAALIASSRRRRP